MRGRTTYRSPRPFVVSHLARRSRQRNIFVTRQRSIPHSPPRERSLARTMPLIYAFVARRTTVLAEYTNYSGNFSTIATQVGPRASRAMGNARERARGSKRARGRVVGIRAFARAREDGDARS